MLRQYTVKRGNGEETFYTTTKDHTPGEMILINGVEIITIIKENKAGEICWVK